MKENHVVWIKILKGFYHDIIKRSILMFIIGALIVFVVKAWRFNPLVYIICFVICFGINLFLFFMKREVRKEFYESN